MRHPQRTSHVMPFFVAGATSVYSTMYLATLIFERETLLNLPESSRSILLLAVTMVAVPLLAAWLVGELMGLVFHKRLFDTRRPRPAACLLAGLGAGFLGVLVSALMLVLLDRSLPDTLICALSATSATMVVLLPFPRQHHGVCPSCGYDLSGATPSAGGLCTECGFALLAPARNTTGLATASSRPVP